MIFLLRRQGGERECVCVCERERGGRSAEREFVPMVLTSRDT